MDNSVLGPIVLAVAMIATGVMTVVIGRRGAAGRLDYSWGGFTKSNTDPEAWAGAHLAAGPRIAIGGFLIGASGVVAPVLMLAGRLGLGLAALVGFVIAGVAMLMKGVGAGLGVLMDSANE